MHRTLTSNLVSELVKQRRIRVCTTAIDAAPALTTWRTLSRVFGEWDGLLGSIDFGRSVIRCIGNPGNDPRTDFCVRCIVAVIIVRSQQDGGCSDLAADLLGISDGHHNNVLLANLIFTTRLIVRFHSEHSRDALSNVSSRTLDELSFDVDVRRAPSELQQEFCNLWNELVRTARDGPDVPVRSISTKILRRIRRSHIAFHENTDPTIPTPFYESTNDHEPILYHGSAYPLCSVQSHHPISPHPAPHSPEMAINLTAMQGTTIAPAAPPTIDHPADPLQVTNVPTVSHTPAPTTSIHSSSTPQLGTLSTTIPRPSSSSFQTPDPNTAAQPMGRPFSNSPLPSSDTEPTT
ncbi:hypothetical protein BJY52DRAFT_803703 [Lactarius psammicola]|nr:hypothetical protein BJY52DRAFT_803703 [Lactarius psammicola]